MTASRVASSSLLNSLHVMVSAFGGAGTTGTSVFLVGNPGIGMSGIGMPGSPGIGVDGRVARRCDVSGGPGSVVIATVPWVVRWQPAVRPSKISAAAGTRTCVLIRERYAHARRSVGACPRTCGPGPDSPPADELQSAEATLAVLQHVLHGIAKDDESKQTPCREFDVAKLTDHLMNSITVIGGHAGAEFPERDRKDSVERQVILAARPALDAWHRRGLDGTVPFGGARPRARMMAGMLSIEFLVHAWDYAKAIGRTVKCRTRCPTM